jgi:hypothetical protein
MFQMLVLKRTSGLYLTLHLSLGNCSYAGRNKINVNENVSLNADANWVKPGSPETSGSNELSQNENPLTDPPSSTITKQGDPAGPEYQPGQLILFMEADSNFTYTDTEGVNRTVKSSQLAEVSPKSVAKLEGQSIEFAEPQNWNNSPNTIATQSFLSPITAFATSTQPDMWREVRSTLTGALRIFLKDKTPESLLASTEVFSKKAGVKKVEWNQIFNKSESDTLEQQDATLRQLAVSAKSHLQGHPTAEISISGNPLLSKPTSFSIDQDQYGTTIIGQEGKEITLTGNVWKSFAVDMTITSGTILEFEFTVIKKGDLQGVGVILEGKTARDAIIFKATGTQEGLENADISVLTKSANLTSLKIPISSFAEGKIASIALINDNDVAVPDASIKFSSLKLYNNSRDTVFTAIPPKSSFNGQVSIDDNLITAQ